MPVVTQLAVDRVWNRRTPAAARNGKWLLRGHLKVARIKGTTEGPMLLVGKTGAEDLRTAMQVMRCSWYWRPNMPASALYVT